MNNNKLVYIFAVLIFLGAFFLRFYNISITPPGIYPDEAVNGQDALKVLDGAQWQWFYPDNQGREGLFMNLVAVSFAIFGVSAMSLKLPAVIFGSLTVLGTFFLSRELFRNDRIALCASLFNAVAFTAVNFSRISFRANMLPFVLVWSFYFLYKGLHSKKYRDFMIAGAIFGIGMHTYIAFRIAPFILIILIPFLVLARHNFVREYWRFVTVFILFFIFSSAPMFYTFWHHPEFFASRSEHVSVFSSEVNHGHPVKTFFTSFSLSLLKYNFVSDMNWRNNYPPYPILDPMMGVLFFCGFFYSVYRSIKSLYQRIKQKIYSDDIVIYPFLLIWFFAMLVPEFLTFESNPHALRSIGALPVVYIFSGLFVGYVLSRVKQLDVTQKRVVLTVLYSAIIFITIFNPIKYLVFWADNVKTAIFFEKNITELAYYIQTIPEDKEVYVILGNMQRVPVRMFNWGRTNYLDVNQYELDRIQPENPQKAIYLFSDFHKDEIQKALIARFPHLQLRAITNDVGQKFYIME